MVLLDSKRSYTSQDLEIFNLLQHPVWVFDIEQKAMFWANSVAVQLWKADSLSALLSRDFASDLSEAAASRMRDHLTRFKRGETLKEMWTYYPEGKGATTLVVAASGIRIEGGRVAALAEAEMPDTHSFDDSTVRGIELLRHLPLAIRQYSIGGTLKYQNPEAINCYGTSTRTSDIKHDNGDSDFVSRFVDRELGKHALQQVQAGKEFTKEVEHYTLEGSKWHSVAVRRTRDPISAEHIILQSAQDISKVVQAREDTAAANLKSEFMDSLAHEIRTPLHQMIGFMDLLEDSDLQEQQREQVKLVQFSSAALMAIVNDLLDYSKLESGKLQIESIPFDMTNVLSGCIAAAESEAIEKGLSVVTNVSRALPIHIIGDPNRMRQICLNLLSNAIKFTEKGSVSLSVELVEDRIRFEVTDTGIGIEESQQQFLFEKYRQANSAVARNYGGTGLGLAICKGLVEAMGGKIGLRSELHQGTTVFFELLLQVSTEEERITRQEQGGELSVDSTKPLLILVVEDNKINQKVVCAMLKRIGHTTAVAENGQIAIDMLHEKKYDVVLMDIQMPVMGGIEATKEIRDGMGLGKDNLPVIGLTASFQHSQLAYFENIGMNNCIGKPVKLNALKDIINSVTKRILPTTD
jgi:signal transduction histidine kinase